MASEKVVRASACVMLNLCFAMNAAEIKTTQAEACAIDGKWLA